MAITNGISWPGWSMLSHATITAAYLPNAHAREKDMLIFGNVLANYSEVRGGALYRDDGTLMGNFGEPPMLTLEAVQADARDKRLCGQSTL